MKAERLLADALAYGRRGWALIPVRYGHNGLKKGAVRWKHFQERPPTPQRLRAWFTNGKYPALAVILDPVSGNLACRDFDKPGSYEAWAAGNSELAKALPTVRTGKGYHVYFVAPVPRTLAFDDGELRGAKSLCVLPPSPHPRGTAYRWIVPLPDGPLPEIDPAAAGFTPKALVQKRTEENGREQTQSDSNRRNQSAGSEGGRGDARPIPLSHCKDEIENAIAATLPTRPGQRNRKVFGLARALKGIPALAKAAPQSLRAVVLQWHERALPCLGTKEFEETWIDFLYAWPRITTPMRLNLLEDAMDLAKANPLESVPYESPGVLQLLDLCRGLQAIVGDQPFFLATRTAARVLNVPVMTAWRWLFLLQQDGWITPIAQARAPRDTYKATRFRLTKPVPEVPDLAGPKVANP